MVIAWTMSSTFSIFERNLLRGLSLSFRLLSFHFISFHFIFSRKVAMTSKVNNSSSIGQIPTKLYIFGIVRDLWVYLKKNFGKIWRSVTSRDQKPGIGENVKKVVKNSHFLTVLWIISNVLLHEWTCNCTFY